MQKAAKVVKLSWNKRCGELMHLPVLPVTVMQCLNKDTAHFAYNFMF